MSIRLLFLVGCYICFASSAPLFVDKLKFAWMGTATDNGVPDIRAQPWSAIKLAIEKINREKKLLPNTTLYAEAFNDNRSTAIASNTALILGLSPDTTQCTTNISLTRSKKYVALIGPGYSNLCDNTAQLLAAFKYPQMSPGCSGAELSNKAVYPYFSRTSYMVVYESQKMIRVARSFGWDRVGILSVDGSFGQSGAQAMQAYASQVGVKITFTIYMPADGKTAPNYEYIFDTILSTNTRIIMAYGNVLDPYEKIWNASVAKGMMKIPYVWFICDSLTTSMVPRLAANTSFPGAKAAMAGQLGMNGYINTIGTPEASEFLSMWAQIKAQNDTVSWPGTQFGSIHVSTPSAYDAVFVYAAIFQQVMLDGKDVYDGDEIQNRLKGFTYRGVLGSMVFDNNLDLKADHQSAFYYDTKGKIQLFAVIINDTVNKVADVVWSDGTTEVPIDGPPLAVTYINQSLYIAIAVITAVFICISSLIIVFILMNWNRLKSQSPPFLMWIVVSNIALLSANFVMGLDENLISSSQVDGICMFRMWLFGIPFVTSLGSLLVKNIRIWLIFSKIEHLEVVKMSTMRIVLLASIPVIIEIIILVIWTNVKPLTSVIKMTSEFEAVQYCTCDSPVMVIIYFLYKGVILAVGVVVAMKTRNIVSKFNEAKVIGTTIYNFALVMAIVVPIVIVFLDSINASFAITAAGIFLLSVGSNVIIFVPKLYFIANINSSTELAQKSGSTFVSSSSTI